VPFRYDDSRAPLLVVTSSGNSTNEEFDAYLKIMTEMLGRHPRYGIIMDARQSARPSPTQRQKQADWMKQHAATIRARNVGIGFVIDNAIVRGALTAILWLQPTPAPHKVFASVEAAERWVTELLEQEGLKVPPRPRGRTGSP
jgi:hypothetical protein